MEQNYFTRKIDNLGRLSIPKEYRKILDINNRDLINISLSSEGILLRKENIEINYVELIRKLLIIEGGEQYSDYLISENDIKIYKTTLEQLADNLLRKEKEKNENNTY